MWIDGWVNRFEYFAHSHGRDNELAKKWLECPQKSNARLLRIYMYTYTVEWKKSMALRRRSKRKLRQRDENSSMRIAQSLVDSTKSLACTIPTLAFD